MKDLKELSPPKSDPLSSRVDPGWVPRRATNPNPRKAEKGERDEHQHKNKPPPSCRTGTGRMARRRDPPESIGLELGIPLSLGFYLGLANSMVTDCLTLPVPPFSLIDSRNQKEGLSNAYPHFLANSDESAIQSSIRRTKEVSYL